MKRTVAFLAALLALLTLFGCGNTAPVETEETAPSTTVQTEASTGTTAAQDKKSLAQSCEGQSVADLFALVGQPDSSEYAPSCLNPGKGEDGMLYYDGFVVYTYKEGDTETVQYVE